MPFPRASLLGCATAWLLVAFIGPASLYGATPPDDSRAYHLLILTRDPASPACAALTASLASPEVAAIAAKTKVFRFTPGDPVYAAHYAAAIPPDSAPSIALVRYDGGVIYKASGAAIPRGAALAAALRSAAAADRASHGLTSDASAILRRPGLIPDTIAPTINLGLNLPAWLPIVGGLLVLGLVGLMFLGAVLFVFLTLYLRRN
jgi:hypothetical protein